MVAGNRPPRLDNSEIADALATIPDWELQEDRLCRTLIFSNFVEAFAFMTEIAAVAERLNHHPEWRNVYNRVEIALTTHDAGGITVLDLELAREIDALAGRKK